MAEEGNVLIALSCSGQPDNIVRAVDAAKNRGFSVITLSGFRSNNPLRKSGGINFYVPADQYRFVELGHSILAHYLSDTAKDRITPSISK